MHLKHYLLKTIYENTMIAVAESKDYMLYAYK